MTKFRTELRRKITEHNVIALKLFEEAKWLRQRIPELPLFKRNSVMEQVNALEQAAVREQQMSLALEKQLSFPNSE